MTRYHRCSIPAAVVLAVLAAAPARAGFVLVTDRADLGGNDSATFDGLGPPGTAIAPILSLTTAGGAHFTLNDLSPGFGPSKLNEVDTLNGAPAITKVDSGPAAFRGLTSTVALDFDQPVRAVGLDLSVLSSTPGFGHFVLDIRAYNASGQQLFATEPVQSDVLSGSITFAGFAGIRSDSANISKLDIMAITSNSNRAQIISNTITIAGLTIDNPSASPATVPEPSTLSLLGTGMLGLLGYWTARARATRIA